MRIFKALLAVFIPVFVLVQCSTPPKNKDAYLQQVQQNVLTTNEKFKQKIQHLLQLVENGAAPGQIKQSFDSTRIIYKQMEWAVAYYMPQTARFTNGPALDEIEFEENVVLEAEGLQVLEEYIYAEQHINSRSETIRMLKKLLNKANTINTYFSANAISLPQLIDALRSQVFRITTLGITGFDTPVSGNGLAEAGVSLSNITSVLKILMPVIKDKKLLDAIFLNIQTATKTLASASDRNSFDYLNFITDHLNPISENIYSLKIKEGIATVHITKAVSDDAATLFSKNAFNADAFVPGEAYKQTPEKIVLGKKIFNDNILSGAGDRSCASCHKANIAFTDGEEKPVSINGKTLLRNTPSLNYANYQHGQFWDMRQVDLETQSEDVITNKDELHGSLAQIITKLNAEENYSKQFKRIYKTDTIKTWQLQNVLAAYIRSLAGFSSSFDEYMRGNKTAITKNQVEGFNLFVGKAKCATCHFIPLFNGTVPPDFAKTESEVLGTAQNFNNKKLDADSGRGRFHPTVPQLLYAFKTPTIRNVAKTAPYMHNGGYQTLQQVMDFYNEGGGQNFGFNVPHQTLPADKLNLTQEEMNKIIDFMNALNDEEVK